MASNEWQELQALQEMLARVQSTELPPTLSEQNCVELVQKLIDLGMIELIHTLDGREYLTHEQLFLEIEEETLAHSGRISLIALQNNLNVDISYIQKFANDLCKRDNHWLIIQSDFMHRSHMDKWCEELNDSLQEAGVLSITDICTQHNFTRDFVLSQVQQRLGHSIQGHVEQNGEVLFTEGYIERQKGCIRGLLNAVTQPIKVQSIMKRVMKEEKLFQSILTQLVSNGDIKGSFRGSLEKEIFFPKFYVEAQESWIDSSIQANGYTDYDRLMKAGVSDPISYIQRNYSTLSYFQLRKRAGVEQQLDIEKFTLIFLDASCISNRLLSEIQASIENTLANDEWVDIASVAPPVFNRQDCVMTLQLVASCIQDNIPFSVYCDTIMVPKQFLENLPAKFDVVINGMVRKITQKCPHLNQLLQILTGRASKFKLTDSTPSKPKKGKGKRNSKFHDQDEEFSNQFVYPELECMNTAEISSHLLKSIREIPADFMEELAVYLEQPLTSRYHSILLEAIKSKTKGHQSSTEVYSEISISWCHIAVFKQAIDESNGLPKQLFARYLLSSICSETTNLLLYLLVKDFCNEPISDPRQLSESKRTKLVSLLNERQRPLMTQLCRSLQGNEVETYLDTMDRLCENKAFGIKLESPNSKKRKMLISGLRDSFCNQLKDERDFATILHLAAVIMYSGVTGLVLHSPGRGVPQILNFLASNLSGEKMSVLRHCQTLVVKKMVHLKEKEKWETEGDFIQETQRINQQLAASTEEVKSMIIWD